MSMALSGKVSIITGASSGLGQATAIMFARKGAMITLCGRDSDRLKAVLDQCTQASGGHQDRFITVQGDVNEASVRQEIVDKTVQTFGQLDVVVPNAGFLLPGLDIERASEEVFDVIFDTNVKSVFFLIQLALPSLAKSKGNIVNVSSFGASVVMKGVPVYAMSKAAVDHMTRCLALDLAPKGIRVNAVNPSYFSTRVFRSFSDNPEEVDRQASEKEKANQPMGELGTPDDVANAITFLASDAAKFITGQCLGADGGRSLTAAFQV